MVEPAETTPLNAGTLLTDRSGRVKEARKLSRRSVRAERRLFLADGPKAVEGALAALLPDGSGCALELFITVAAASQHAELVGRATAQDVAVTLVDDRALAALSDSVTPAGVVALCRFLDVPTAALFAPAPQAGTDLIAICAEVRDPGNAGTVIRCADAAGADGVVLAGDSVDAYNPKTVRASVGSLFHVPVAIERDAASAVRAAQAAGLTVLAADGAGERDLFAIDELLSRPTAWLFGNEAWGLPRELADLADHRVRIPIHGRAESLNLATAAALCLYASARAQRA